MKRLKLLLPAIAIVGVGLFLGRHARAADHIDGPQATGAPEADLADVFTWMNADNTKINLVLTVNTTVNSAHTTLFSDAVKYVFHTESHDRFLAPTSTQSKDIICTFTGTASPQTIQCWVGTDEYVTGDASNTAGISSADGKVKVFAGARDDPFFFNLDGFHKAVATVEGAVAANALTFDNAGCPQLDTTTSDTLVGQLSHNPVDGGPAVDTFAGANKNVMAIVMQVDKTLLTGGGPFVSVWAATTN